MKIEVFDSTVGNWRKRVEVENERITGSNDVKF
jgi:hypothetical protein